MLFILFFLDGFMVRTRCPPISKFRLGFSFPSFGSGGASFGRWLSLGFLFCHCCSFSCVCIGSFGCGYGCHALGWILCGRFSFPPFRLDLSGLGVGVPSQSLEFLVLLVWPPLPNFLRFSCVHLVPVCFAGPVPFVLLFEVFRSAFEIPFSCCPFGPLRGGGLAWGVFPLLCFCGVLVLLSSVLRWGLWTLLLALGRFVLLSLSGPLAVQLRSFLCMWFRQNFGVSSFQRSLWWSAGRPDPGTFCWCCGTLSLPCLSLWSVSLWILGRGFLFCFSLLRLRFPFYGLF